MGQGYTRNDTSNNIADGNVINASDLDGEFNAVDAAFNESSGHTHDGTADEGAPVTVLGPVQDFVASATEIKPKTSNTLDIGTTSLQFKDMYLDGTAYIDGLGEDILVATDKKVQFRDTALFINSSTDGQLDIAADTEVEITTALVEISADATVGDDLTLKSDAAVLGFGADTDVTLTHVADTGLLVNAAMVVQFRDSAINIGSPADGDLDINADDEIELNSTLIDINGNVEISGTLSQTGIATFTDDIIIGDGKTIGSASAVDAMTISSGGIVTFKDDILIKDGGTIGVASDADAITIASNGQLTLTQQLNGAAGTFTTGTFSGILKTDDATEATSTTDGSLQTDGGLSVVKDAVFGDDIKLLSDSAVIHFGADSDITLTHAADTSLATNGVMIATTFEPTGDTAAGDNAAIGYTAAEGLILTGQGSTSDITLKNDADATVFTVPTGTDDILFPDGAKAMFGAGSDLQIYHDGSNSYINETGTGDLYIRTSNEIRIQDGNQSNFLYGVEGADLRLYHNGSEKLRTESTGCSVTGALTTTAGATIAGGDLLLDEGSPEIIFQTGASHYNWMIAAQENVSNAFEISSGSQDGDYSDDTFTPRLVIDSSGNLLVGTTGVNAAGVISVDFDGQAKQGITLDDTYASTGGYYIYFRNSANAQAGAISHTGSTTVNYSTSSDYRLKTAVNYDWDATTRLKQLRPARFEWIADGDDAVPVDGFLAHEVQGVVPEAISGTKDAMMDEEYEVSAATGDIYTPATDDADEVIHSANVENPDTLEEGQQWRETTAAVMGTRSVPDLQGIDQSKLVPLLCKTILELEARITALEA